MRVHDRKSYQEMLTYDTFDERFDYLSLGGVVGDETFGPDRQLNQDFYRSVEWRNLRSYIIARDNGFDLAIPDKPIFGRILIHHINPLSRKEVVHGGPSLLDPNNLVCVSHITHNALHYGDKSLLPKPYVPRRAGDTKLW